MAFIIVQDVDDIEYAINVNQIIFAKEAVKDSGGKILIQLPGRLIHADLTMVEFLALVADDENYPLDT